MQCVLTLYCTLCAANPVGGHYDKAKTVSENLKMSPALLSRFDLVFILLDEVGRRMEDMPRLACCLACLLVLWKVCGL